MPQRKRGRPSLTLRHGRCLMDLSWPVFLKPGVALAILHRIDPLCPRAIILVLVVLQLLIRRRWLLAAFLAALLLHLGIEIPHSLVVPLHPTLIGVRIGCVW